MRLRRIVVVFAVAAGACLAPAQRSEAALFSCLRRLFHPCDRCATPCASYPEPVISEGSYLSPCATGCAAVPTSCTTCATSYVQRSYMEPQTCMTRQCSLQPRTCYVRRSYWDPCACSYRTYLEPTTSYVRRCSSVPVTTYVQRSYLEPVTTCAPSPCATCPTPCPTSCPTTACPGGLCPTPEIPADPAAPVYEGSGRDRRLTGRSAPVQAAPLGNRPTTRARVPLPPSQLVRPATEASVRPVPLAAGDLKFSTF